MTRCRKTQSRRESEILKTISLHSRGEKELLIQWSRLEGRNRNYERNLSQFRGGKRNLNCFQNDNKTRLVKTFPFCNLCLTQCQDEVRNQSCMSRGERDMKFSFSRVREKDPNHFSSRLSRDRDS